MGTGYLSVRVTTADGLLPVANAKVAVTAVDGGPLYNLAADAAELTKAVAIEAPDKIHTLDPNDQGQHYNTVDVKTSAEGFNITFVHGVQILDTITTVLPVNLIPMEAGQDYPRTEDIYVPRHHLEDPGVRQLPSDNNTQPISPWLIRDVVIPNYITVHLGLPTAAAQNVRVPWKDYIKNVATHEIYSTWPVASLQANILAQQSLAINRVFTEYWTSRGYPFNITNSTRYDQMYVHGGGYAANIGALVDGMFNQYARRAGRREPFFTEYCNGTSVSCPGMSQWGTVNQANQGRNALQILRYYYNPDMEVVETNNFSDNLSSYPGAPLRLGSTGRDVAHLQTLLNRIGTNFPSFGRPGPVDGVFGTSTANSVRAFQSYFGLQADGVVGKATWDEISRVFVGVTKMAELGSEGWYVGVGASPPTSIIQMGSVGSNVSELQFLLNYISQYVPAVRPVLWTGTFDAQTRDSVMSFQTAYGLSPDGIVGSGTWTRLYAVYQGIQHNAKPPEPEPMFPPFPGTALRQGSTGPNVIALQRMINQLSAYYPQIPRLVEDGSFGNNTRLAVVQVQNMFALNPDGVVGMLTWNAIVAELIRIGGAWPPSVPKYPGSPIRRGASGPNVTLVQEAINVMSARFPSIPRLTVDGVFGAATENAVGAFQRQFGLTVDGVVGPVTWGSLFQNAAPSGAPLREQGIADAPPLYGGQAELDSGAWAGDPYGFAPPVGYAQACPAVPGQCDFVGPMLRMMLLRAIFASALGYYR